MKRKKSPMTTLVTNLGSSNSSFGEMQRSPNQISANPVTQQLLIQSKTKTQDSKSNLKQRVQINSPTMRLPQNKPAQIQNNLMTPQFSMQGSTGSISAHPSSAFGSIQAQKLNYENMNQKWPQYLNSLKNVEVSEPSSIQQYPSSGYSSQPSIKKPLASAKKANITGLSKGYPNRAQAPATSNNQNQGSKKQNGRVNGQITNRGAKQLRSDSPRQTEAKFKLSSKELIGKQVQCQTRISVNSAEQSSSPNAQPDSKYNQSLITNRQQQSKITTQGRVSRVSDCRVSLMSHMAGSIPRNDFKHIQKTNNSSRAFKNHFVNPNELNDYNEITGPRPFSKPPITQVVVPKTQNPSIRNSPKLEVAKAIYIATDGADVSQKDDSSINHQIGQQLVNQQFKSPNQNNNNSTSSSNLKSRFQNALQPSRHSRNQPKLSHAVNRQSSKLNVSNSSYGISGNLMRFTTGAFGMSNQALKSSPALWGTSKFEDEKRRTIKGVGAVPDHMIPTATLHLTNTSNQSKNNDQNQNNIKSALRTSEQTTNGTKAIYGVINPRRPSAGYQINKHSRTNTLEIQDSRRNSNHENQKSAIKSKLSPRSNKSRDLSKKRGSPPNANCLSELSAKSSGSKTSGRLKQRKMISRNSNQNKKQMKSAKNKQVQQKEIQEYNNLQSKNMNSTDHLKESYIKLDNANMHISVSASKKSGSNFQKKKSNQSNIAPNRLSINRLRSYSPRVNLSQLQNIKIAKPDKLDAKRIDQTKARNNQNIKPTSSYLHITEDTSVFNTVIVKSAQVNQFDQHKIQAVSDSDDTMTPNQINSGRDIGKQSNSKKNDSSHFIVNGYSGSGSPERRERRGVAYMNTTAGMGSQGESSRFFASHGTTESRGKRFNGRDKSINSGIYSPRSKGNNDSNMMKSNMADKGTTIESSSQNAVSQFPVNQKASVQVSRVFLNLVESLLKNIQIQLNPRQIKDFERSITTLMTQKAKEIDPYLKIKCFQISNQMQTVNSNIKPKILERGNILHFLSASGHFPGLLDFILRKKCQAKPVIDKNELTLVINDGNEDQGHTSLHLACLSLRQKSIEKLLLSRVNVNLNCGAFQDTPLHLLIKMYSQQLSTLSKQTEDLGADMDLEDIRECIQLILPFCEESLTLKNIDGNQPNDLIVKNQLDPLINLLNEHYHGYIQDMYQKGSDTNHINFSRQNDQNQKETEHIKIQLHGDHNFDVDYIEVKAEELDEFLNLDNKQQHANLQRANSKQWQSNSKDSELFSNGSPPRNQVNHQILKNYLEKKSNGLDNCKTAEGLSSSAQQAQRKESTKSIKETSRKYELSEIEEKDSPLEGQVDKTATKRENVIDTVKIAYIDAPYNAMRAQDANLIQQSREESHTEWKTTTNNPKSDRLTTEVEGAGQFISNISISRTQHDLQQVQQSQMQSIQSEEAKNPSNIINADQCGEQSAEAQDRHSGLAFTAINQTLGVISQGISKQDKVNKYDYDKQQMQTGGSQSKLHRQQPIITVSDPDSSNDKYVKSQHIQSASKANNNSKNEQQKSRSLRRQSREDDLSAKRQTSSNQINIQITKAQLDMRDNANLDHQPCEQPENFTESNASNTFKTRQDPHLTNHANTLKTPHTAQNLQSINTKQQSVYLQSQINQSPQQQNRTKRVYPNDKSECQTMQTIFNVDTPEKAYDIHFNDNMSESIQHDPESQILATIGGASQVEFDNVSSLKQNIKRMQLSDIHQSMQSGADSRISRRSQRPFKMANKKVIGGESFVVTVGGNEADFAESDKKQGKLLRIPPNFQPNPSQPNQISASNSKDNDQIQKDIDTEKQSQNFNKSIQNDDIGPHSFLTHQLLGTGSFGEVFLVEEKKTGKLMAMKVLSKQKAREQKLLKYNFAEKEIMARMTMADHPFVVKLYYTFQTTESLFMVMEFCAGGDLSQYLEVEGCFGETKAKQYICEIVCAIEALHENDIIFRDLKPDNIVLDSEGHAMLVDFGLSRQNVKGQSNGADSFCGSYAYLAPEMIKKKGHGKAVDWYLIGVVLYELLTGMPPFYDDDKEILFKNITNQKLEFPPEEELPLTRVCRDFIAQLLHKDPTKRLGIQNGIKDIKNHAFFAGVDWYKVQNKKYRQPEAYLAEMALSIIRKDPYALKDHPRTKGRLSQPGDPNHLDGWEINLVKDYKINVKAPIMNKKELTKI